MKQFSKFLLLCILTLIIYFSFSCTLNEIKNKKSLRLGYMPNVTHATALIGIEKNIFQEELGNDIKFKPINFVIGNSIIDAFITNQIDAAYVGPGPVINALYRNVPIKLLSNASNGGTLIVGTMSLLPDSKIAVPQYGNTQDLILRSYLNKNDLLNKVKILAIPPQDTATAFFTMSIDAACLPEPWATILVGGAYCSKPLQVLVDEKAILNNGNYPVTLLVVNKQYAEANPDLTKKILIAHKKANSFIINNSQETVEIVRKAISRISNKEIDKNVIAKSLKRCIFNDEVDLNVLDEFKEIGVKAGYYKKEFLSK